MRLPALLVGALVALAVTPAAALSVPTFAGEFAVSGLRYVALTQGITISASGLGKSKMVAQVVAVALLLIAPWDPAIRQLGDVAIFVVVVLTILSMYDYFRGFWNKVDGPVPAKPAPRPIPARER